jgi:hypothetical protein
MFRLSVKTQVVRGEIHYHATMASHMGNVVGILVFNPQEWLEFLAFCQASHFEVKISESIPPALAEASATR